MNYMRVESDFLWSVFWYYGRKQKFIF